MLAIRQLACKESPVTTHGAHVGDKHPCLPIPTASPCSLKEHAGVSGLCQDAAKQLQGRTQNNISPSRIRQAAHPYQAIARPGVTLTAPLARPCHRRSAKPSNNKPTLTFPAHTQPPCMHGGCTLQQTRWLQVLLPMPGNSAGLPAAARLSCSRRIGSCMPWRVAGEPAQLQHCSCSLCKLCWLKVVHNGCNAAAD